ncbi:hypothetical protein KKG41_03870 [Patescibacteria group bacterium]|nr:hypothetical protein [Patescibacteria group bacterium]
MNMNASETGCCPSFNPEGWDNRAITFENKLFVKTKTRSIFHIPINMGSVFKRAMQNIEAAKASPSDSYLILSYDPSAWTSEHYIAIDKEVPNESTTTLTGKYQTKVFEGPYRDARKWVSQMAEHMKSSDKEMKKLYFFYTTCPKCLKYYGKNYVVAFAEVK